MECLTGNAAIPTDSLANGAARGADNTLEEAESASNFEIKATITSDQQNNAVASCRPEYETGIASADREEKPNNGIPTPLQLVTDSIKQVADGLSDISAVVKEIRESVKLRLEDDSSTESSDGPEDDGESVAEVDEGQNDASAPIIFPSPKRIIPEYRICNWEEFKNSFSREEVGYCVEALKAGDNLEKVETDDSLEAEVDKNVRDNAEKKSDSYLQQIRIQSKTVMKLLTSFYETDDIWEWGDEPVIFKRPFRCPIYFQDRMQSELKRLEEEVATSIHQAEQSSGVDQKDSYEMTSSDTIGSESQTATQHGKDGQHENSSMDENPRVPANLHELQERLGEVRCYVEFVDTHIMPLSKRFELSGSSKPQKVRFHDLWYLFKIGGLIYRPPRELRSTTPVSFPGLARATEQRQTIWRTYRNQLPFDDLRSPDAILRSTGWEAHNVKNFALWYYYIEFNGTTYGTLSGKFVIQPFEGERDIQELAVYPLSYAKDAAKILELSREDGIKFTAILADKRKHATHAGWTVTHDPEGVHMDGLNSQNEKTKLSPEHIESDVVFDFAEAFNFYPPWAPKLSFERPAVLNTNVKRDTLNYIKWSDEHRSEKLAIYHEFIVCNDAVSDHEFNSFLEKDEFLSRRSSKPPMSEDDFALLPKRMFGYALWERKFVLVDVRNVEQRIGDDIDNPFNNLQIDHGHKKMIQALISSYLANKRLEDDMRTHLTQDLIRGKGKGVVILLHGLPGVGKTATAEAVAHKWNKPLFPITCGDLGFTATTVEKTLNDVFRFAHLWECVLLLDEADVFITQRSKSDLKRNALVSVFLRMLEYYNGILFLTTNRPGVLDEAVKSRVHLSLRYEALTLEQTKEIFKINIARLRKIEQLRNNAEIEKKKKEGGQDVSGRMLAIHDTAILDFAEKHFKDHTNDLGRWNGRQIRNAFSIAASLAHFVADDNPGLPRFLSAEQFREVQDATLLYDQYRRDTLQQTDSERAQQREERWDDDNNDPSPAESSRRPQAHR